MGGGAGAWRPRGQAGDSPGCALKYLEFFFREVIMVITPSGFHISEHLLVFYGNDDDLVLTRARQKFGQKLKKILMGYRSIHGCN